MNHLDCFSGVGGWALAARWMGWNTAAFVEKDKFCQKVLAKNFPDVPIYDDITTFSGKPFRGRIGILSGSTPCQPFSQAGKREGSNDERHLFPEFLRVVAETRPRWIVIENVYGLINIESGQVFEDYHASLESEGYSVQTLCIPASALNAPHRRDRLWIVAHANSLGERAGHRQVQSTDGEISERYDDAESIDSAFGVPANTLNGQHRAVTGPQSEKDSIQSIGGAEGFSGRISGTVDDVVAVAANARTTRREREQTDDAVSGRFRSNLDRGRQRFDGCPDAADSDSQRLQRGNERTNGTGQSETGFGLRNWDEAWPEVAARFCRVDDVVPDGLDEYSVADEIDAILGSGEIPTAKKVIKNLIARSALGNRDNRVSRLKALGNAIVPQIAYEIFKAIESADAQKQPNKMHKS